MSRPVVNPENAGKYDAQGLATGCISSLMDLRWTQEQFEEYANALRDEILEFASQRKCHCHSPHCGLCGYGAEP